jgi:hypothetical protein
MSLVTQINSLITRIGTEFKATKNIIAGNTSGDLSGLNTSAKNNIVSAINELKSGLNAMDSTVNHNRGWFATTAALIAAVPSGSAGDYAIVGATDTVWIWDTDGTPSWKDSDTRGAVSSVNGQTGAVVIANATTGADGLMSSTDKTKLNSIATGATANDTDANLKNRANHTGSQLSSTISDFASSVLAQVLTGLSVAASSVITATDSILVAMGKLQAQITSHVGSGGAAHASAISGGEAGFMTGTDKSKLDGLTNYTHPSGDGNLHVPATGTGNNLKVLKAGPTPGSSTWGNVDFGELTGKPTTISGFGITDSYSKSEIGDLSIDFVAAFNTAIA